MQNSHHVQHGKWYVVRKKGGLGALNLKIQNEVLIMKGLHKFFNHVLINGVNHHSQF
jgi:hypothetical protein